MSEADPPSAGRPRRRWMRRLAIASAVLLVLAVALVLLLPTLASTGPGTGFAVGVVNRSLSGTLAVDDLDVGWFSATRVAGVTLTGADGQTIVRIEELALPDRSLLGLLRSSEDLGAIRGRDIDLQLVRYDDGSTNLDRALRSDKPKRRTERPSAKRRDSAGPDYHADVQLQNVHLTLAAPGVETVTLEAPRIHAQLDGLNQLELDIEANVAQGALSGRIAATGGVRGLAGTQPTADLEANVQSLPVAALDSLLGYDGRLLALLGDQLDAQLTFAGALHDAALHVDARSPQAEAKLPLHLSADALRSAGAAQVRLTVTPAAYAAWIGSQRGELLTPVTLAVNLTELHVPMADGRPVAPQARAVLDLAADALALRIAELGDVELSQASGRVTLDRAAGIASLALTGPFTLDGQSGELNLNGRVAGLGDAAGYTLDVTLTDLPVPIADELAGQNGRVTALLGSTATLTVKGAYPGDLDVALRAGETQVDAPLTLSEASWSLRSPGRGRVKLEPAQYAALVGVAAGELTRPLILAADVHELVLPLVEGRPDWAALRAALDMRSSVIEMNVPQVGPMTLERLTGELRTDRATDTATVRVQSPLVAAGVPGSLDAAITLRDTADGPPYDIEAVLTDVPMPLVDQLAQLDGQATALVGPTATLNVRGRFPGALALTLDSRSVQARAPIHVTEDRLVTLTADLSAQVRLEEEGTRRVMARVHPIIADAVRSETPIRLLVRAEGFELPAGDFAFEKLRAKGVLDLGSMRLARSGWFDTSLSRVLSQLGLGRLVESETYVATFTPANFVVANGRVRTEEIWLTTDEMAVGFQGRADVPGDRYEFSMGVMGLTLAAKMRKIPGAAQYADAIATDRIITVPLEGALNRPVPDIVPMVTAIGLDIAGQEGGRSGAGVGAALDIVGGLLGGQRDAATSVKWSPPQAALDLAAALKPKEPAPATEPAAEPATSSPRQLTPEQIERRRLRRERQQQAEPAPQEQEASPSPAP